jgi:hypothetical protein
MLSDLTALKEAGVDAPEAITLMAKLALDLYAQACLEPYSCYRSRISYATKPMIALFCARRRHSMLVTHALFTKPIATQVSNVQ